MFSFRPHVNGNFTGPTKAALPLPAIGFTSSSCVVPAMTRALQASTSTFLPPFSPQPRCPRWTNVRGWLRARRTDPNAGGALPGPSTRGRGRPPCTARQTAAPAVCSSPGEALSPSVFLLTAPETELLKGRSLTYSSQLLLGPRMVRNMAGVRLADE